MNIDEDGLLRIGISLVYIWFGVNQIADPTSFLSFPPSWLPIPAETMVFLNGVLESVMGTMLVFGILTRFASAVLALHMVGIIISVGYNPLAIRDFGLLVALITIFINGKDSYSLWTGD